jgi:hypothetical protein
LKANLYTWWLAGLGLAAVLPPGPVAAQPGPPAFRPPHAGADHRADMVVFHYTRTVTRLDNGVETVTESDRPVVAAKIQQHVEAMHRRLREGRPIHLRDPLFAAVFRHAGEVPLTVERTKKGVKVWETSEDAYVVRLLQAHAEVVNLSVANGRFEMGKDHAAPARP